MTEQPGAVLIVQAGPDRGAVIPLENARHVLGRSPHGDPSFDSAYVSRNHAQIAWNGAAYEITDLGSKNGTFVNGQPLTGAPVVLSGGERIELGQGEVIVDFRLGGSTLTVPGASSDAFSIQAGRAEGKARKRRIFRRRSKGLAIDMAAREVYIADNQVVPPLPRKEFDVLALLYERAGEACSMDEMAAHGWAERPLGMVGNQEIAQCVRRIRLRIEPDAKEPRYLLNVRGYGYKLETG